MHKVGKIIDSDILEEMTEECLSKIWDSVQSTVVSRSEKGEIRGAYSDDRTSKTFKAHKRFYPEFCEQLEEWVSDGSKVNQIDLLLYEKGDKFVKHKDDTGDGKRLWSTSTILHLSDDYVGDSLKIYSGKDSEDFVIPRQEVGDTIIFPSRDTWHEVAPVEQGTRLVAVAWLGFE